MVVALLVVLLPATAVWAQGPDPAASPSPRELWDAYPLVPRDAPATATPSEAATEGASDAAGATPTASGDGGGMPLVVSIGLAAVLAFGLGVGIGRRRRRERRGTIDAVAPASDPPASKPFQWRDYPEPARPAPPPPPPPGAPTFKAALDQQRAAASTQAKLQEPH